MDTKKLIRFCFLAVFGLTPLIFTQFNSELFELPKMYFIYLVALAIISLHLYRYLSGQSPLYQKSWLNFFLLLFLLSQVISTILSVDSHTSIFGYYSRLNGGLVSLFAFSALFFIFPLYLDTIFAEVLVTTILISGFFVSLYGFLEHFGIDRTMWIQDVASRVFSTLGQPNWLAAYLSILLPFAIWRTFAQSAPNTTRTFSWRYALLSLLFFITLLFTKSKTGYIATSISLLIFGIALLLQNRRNASQSFRRIAPLFILFILLSFTINNPVKDFVRSHWGAASPTPAENNAALPAVVNITPSEDIRKIVWQGAFKLWQQFPYFGTGPETFAYTYYWTRPASHNLTSEWDFLYNKAHNEYLNFLATTGSLGFITYGLFILIALYMIARHPSSWRPPVLAAFVAILINNLTGFSVAIVSLYFFLLPVFRPTLATNTSPITRRSNFLPILALILATILIGKTLLASYLADIAYAFGQRSNAVNALDSAFTQTSLAVSLNPDEPIYHSLLAQIYAKKAIASGQKPPFPEDTQKNIDQAIIETQTATHLSPANLNLLKEQAQVYYYLATLDIKYYPNAISSLVKVTKLAPTDAKSYYTLGKFWEAIDNTNEALNAYETAIHLKPNYDYAFFAAAKIYFDQKDYPKAQQDFEAVLAIAPSNQDAKNYLQQIKAATY